jgi:hypothetical protein
MNNFNNNYYNNINDMNNHQIQNLMKIQKEIYKIQSMMEYNKNKEINNNFDNMFSNNNYQNNMNRNIQNNKNNYNYNSNFNLNNNFYNLNNNFQKTNNIQNLKYSFNNSYNKNNEYIERSEKNLISDDTTKVSFKKNLDRFSSSEIKKDLKFIIDFENEDLEYLDRSIISNISNINHILENFEIDYYEKYEDLNNKRNYPININAIVQKESEIDIKKKKI